MASREKRPLVPSKTKQKASNDSGLPSNEVKNKKGRSLPNIKQQQSEQEIFDTVATGSQLSVKVEASLPRRNALKNLKRKQNLRAAKVIKSKVTKKVTNKNLHRISDVKRSIKTKKIKQVEEATIKAADTSLKFSENQNNNCDNEGKGTETPKSAKNYLRTKKTKSDIQNKEETSGTSSAKVSPKLGRKGKTTESCDSLSKSAKTTKLTNFKKNSTKYNFVKVATYIEKGVKSRKSTGKELDCSARNNSNIEKFSKTGLDNKTSIDLTIDEVIASSMLGDNEAESHQGVIEKTEGKVTRSKKMLVDENPICDIEIKKEPDADDMKISSDGEYTESDQGLHFQNAIQLRKRSKTGNYNEMSQRSLRNGKQRQLSDSGNSADNDTKKRHRLNSDGTFISDNLIDTDVNMDSCFSDPNCNESQIIVATSKEEIRLTKEETKSFDEDTDTGSEIENNNNSDRVDRASEIGPMLRSKTKAKTTENESAKDEEVEDARIISKSAEIQEDAKKLNNLDQIRKDSILTKCADKSKNRRTSLNIDIKKTVSSFYSTDKSDSNSKSENIDQMIQSIKLNIAKNIEINCKIFNKEPGLGLSKSIDVPKIEEIVAPLSTESQKKGLEENADEDRSIITKNEITDGSDNSVPKVADTAKEIEEKLVKFDIGEAETHSQNIQENKAADSDRTTNDVHNAYESAGDIGNNNGTSGCVVESKAENVGCSTVSSTSISDNESKTTLDETKKIVATRKSSRISEKSSESSPETKKSNKTPNKSGSKPDNTEDAANERKKSTNEETLDAPSRRSSDNNALSSPIPASPEKIEEQITTDQAKEEESETDITLNVSADSDEPETLESLSREVEELVAKSESFETLPNTVNDAISSKEITSDTKLLNTEQDVLSTNQQEVSACCDDDNCAPIESTVNDTNETPSNSCADENVFDATETSSENDSSCKTAQNAKHHKINNNHLSSTANCDLNSECSSVNSVPAHESDRQNDKIEEVDQDSDSKELNRSTSDTTSNSDENVSDQTPQVVATADQSNKSSTSDKVLLDEQKSVNEENRRVLRARDKQKKIENKRAFSRGPDSVDNIKVKTEESSSIQKNSNLHSDVDMTQASWTDGTVGAENSQKTENTVESQNSNESDDIEPSARTRRGRETKKRKEEPPQLSGGSKSKRVKRDMRKCEQQNKEETLLDNEVAKINENNRSFLKYETTVAECTDGFRGFLGREKEKSRLDKLEKGSNLRSKSENDIMITGAKNRKNDERKFSRNLSENHMSKQTTNNIDILENECKIANTTLELTPKDSDEASTSGDSSNRGTPKILETPEDKERKESILRLLGLESLEEAAKRQQEKTKKEQSLSTGTLKTIIRVSQKDREKDKDKKGSRSPLKMVLKQQGRGDGDGDSPEFYTIQKEFGTSGLGDSSSGANRKFTTNHRHSCEDDNEDATPKDRQSLVIPEKSSSFSIHPGRVCADVCCYCFGKFGSLDTPMHLAQMKSDERRKKILSIEINLTKDSCLCDACYRHVDRKANTSPTNVQQKPQKQHRQLMVPKCAARECRNPARHYVKRRWLLKIKNGVQNQVDIDWESTQHSTLGFCINHYERIGRFLMCALCKRRLAKAQTYVVPNSLLAEINELNQLLSYQGIPVTMVTGTFVCKLCRYFMMQHLKYKDTEKMNVNHKSFCKRYRKRILEYLGIEVEEEEDDSPQQTSQAKDKKGKKGTKNAHSKNGSSKSPDRAISGSSEKSTPEPNKNENAAGCSSAETSGNASRPAASNAKLSNASSNENSNAENVQYLNIESSVENLKKRKMLDAHSYASGATSSSSYDGASTSEMVEIFGMDNEITLTRLPKRPRLNNSNNDITPVVQRLGANPSISVRTLFPGEEEMNLHVNIDFQNVREVTPQGWEKCATMIQYDRETKLLWQKLQRPYGNQSSFLRHLILLEKYYRAGDLILAPNASRNAINYSTSVQNRLISYEGPEKMDEPILDPIATEYSNPRRLSGGYVMEKDRLSLPGTSSMSRASTSSSVATSHLTKVNSSVLKLNPGVSIIKKPPPNLQRLSLPSASGAKRKDGHSLSVYNNGGKVYQANESDLKRVQMFKRQKSHDRQSGAGTSNGSSSQYQKAPIAVPASHSQQFQRHLRMQQEMLSRQSRGDFEPLICDMTRTTSANESGSSSQNFVHNLNLPKSIQVTTKPTSNTPIPILPKIPKSLTVIPQTVPRQPVDK